jgi:hypothetical protein
VTQLMGTPPPVFAALDADETMVLRDLIRKLTAEVPTSIR